MNKYLNIFTTWLPKRLNPLIASRAAFANPTELEKTKEKKNNKEKRGEKVAGYAYNSGNKI